MAEPQTSSGSGYEAGSDVWPSRSATEVMEGARAAFRSGVETVPQFGLSPSFGLCQSSRLQMKIGAIFDWDGVVIDSRKQHEQSWERLAKEENRDLPEGHFLRGFGMTNDRIIPGVLGWASDPAEVARIAQRKEETYRSILREKGISALPGVRTILERLAEAGVPCVIGSSTQLQNITAILDVIGLREFFLDIVSADDVTHGKPHPEIFLTAAQRIAVEPASCVVFEDTHFGIEAGHAGQMKVVAVTTTHPRDELAQADRVVDRLDDLTVADLKSLLAPC